VWLHAKLVCNVAHQHWSFLSFHEPDGQETGTFGNRPWSEFFSKTGIRPDELWEPGTKSCLSTARLFPIQGTEGPVSLARLLWLQPGAAMSEEDRTRRVQRWRASWRVSIATIMETCAVGEELAWRREIGLRVARSHCLRALTQPAYRQACMCLRACLRLIVTCRRYEPFCLRSTVASQALFGFPP
jgi:hypothetical protein